MYAASGAHSADLKPISFVIEEHSYCIVVLMSEMDEAIRAWGSLCEIFHFLTIGKIKVLLLPTMTDPANISHISSFELVILVRFDTVDSADHSSDNRKRVFTVLFLCLDEETFVVYEAGVALEVEAEESVVAA